LIFISQVVKHNICSKLNREFQIFDSIGKYQIHIEKEQLVKFWNAFIELGSNNSVTPPSPNPNFKQHMQCTYNVKFRKVCVTIVAVNKK